jgi:hypothetical protein
MLMADIQRKLYKYSHLKEEILKLDEQIEEERFRLQAYYGCGSQEITGMPGSPSPGDPTGSTVAWKVMPNRERLEHLCRLRDIKLADMAETELFLERLDVLERAIIELRYFRCFTWSDIVEEQYISRSTIFRIHESALGKWKVEAF